VNILDALSQQKHKNDDLRPVLDDGMLAVSLGVFEANLYRMGFNPVEFDDVQPNERGELLSYYEKIEYKKVTERM
jgi:hypothetical protein